MVREVIAAEDVARSGDGKLVASPWTGSLGARSAERRPAITLMPSSWRESESVASN